MRPSITGLDEIEQLILLLPEGGVAPCAEELEDYLDTWRSAQERSRGLQERLNRLTPRELQVLDLLRGGLPVRSIASRLGLSESTVRSQVRAVLHKLDVRSQLAAVALLRDDRLPRVRVLSRGRRASPPTAGAARWAARRRGRRRAGRPGPR